MYINSNNGYYITTSIFRYLYMRTLSIIAIIMVLLIIALFIAIKILININKGDKE